DAEPGTAPNKGNGGSGTRCTLKRLTLASPRWNSEPNRIPATATSALGRYRTESPITANNPKPAKCEKLSAISAWFFQFTAKATRRTTAAVANKVNNDKAASTTPSTTSRGIL